MNISEQNVLLPTDMGDWPSCAYWLESDAGVKQFWYAWFCFNRDREQFHAAHPTCFRGRFERSLSKKLPDSPAAKEELWRIKSRLEWPGATRACEPDGFRAPIMCDTFGEKGGLLRRWRDDTAALRHQTGGEV